MRVQWMPGAAGNARRRRLRRVISWAGEALCSCSSPYACSRCRSACARAQEVLGLREQRDYGALTAGACCTSRAAACQGLGSWVARLPWCSTSGAAGCKATLNRQNQGWLTSLLSCGVRKTGPLLLRLRAGWLAVCGRSDHDWAWRRQITVTCCCWRFIHGKPAR